MSNLLVEFTLQNTRHVPNNTNDPAFAYAVDVGFAGVLPTFDTSDTEDKRQEFITLVGIQNGLTNSDCNPLDGKDHTYAEIAQWLGLADKSYQANSDESYDIALRFMALTQAFGMATVKTPDQKGPVKERLMVHHGLVAMQSNGHQPG